MRGFPILCLALVTLQGCAYNVASIASSVSLGSQEKVLGTAKGRSYATYLFGFGPNGDDSIAAAVKNALLGTDGHTLVNVFADKKIFCFPLPGLCMYRSVETHVFGTVIKYDGDTIRRYDLADPLLLTDRSIPEDIYTWEVDRIYDYCVSTFAGNALRVESLLTKSGREFSDKVVRHVLAKKGSASIVRFEFKANPGLKNEELSFIRWLMPHYSEYKKVVTPG